MGSGERGGGEKKNRFYTKKAGNKVQKPLPYFVKCLCRSMFCGWPPENDVSSARLDVRRRVTYDE